MNIKKTVAYTAGILVAVSLAGCDLNPLNWVNSAKNKFNSSVNADASAEDKASYLGRIEKPTMPIGSSCSNDPALVLCKSYRSVDALLADPNVKNFGFSITVNGVEVHKGSQPDVKYRQLKDGSIFRG